ncbi:MAG TPA: TauD/TfdA family dioxygenase [Pyrinomonadaceae bacterium]|nr:TauD/TfdA family dioxygenase [Pyrinomonadaceae bacterium]
MSEQEAGAPGLRKLNPVRRKVVSGAPASLVKTSLLIAGQGLPLVVEPAVRGVALCAWAAGNRAFIEAHLAEHGGLLFRNFNVAGAGEFEQFIEACAGEPLEYRERSSPRSPVGGNIYTSTDHPADQSIFLHNENSYQDAWPLKIFFYCATPAARGGETPIADVRRIYNRIDPQIRARFAERQWMYIRNFGDGFGLPWPAVFQTTDKQAVEAHCARHGISVEWKDGDRLRTRAVRPAIAKHPRTGELVWFNHATFFHVTTLEPNLRATLLREFGVEDVPTNTCYGDGTPIEPEVLEHLRAAYAQETVSFAWQQGDILLLDNMLVAHGRAPYEGARRILVGMAEPWSDRGL